MIRDRIVPFALVALSGLIACSGKTVRGDATLDKGSHKATPPVAASPAQADASSTPGADGSSAAVAAPPLQVHPIGASCVAADGWTRPPTSTGGSVETVLPDGGISIQLIPVSGPYGPEDLPPGVGYCDQGNDGNQSSNGYWTQTCWIDADCPAGSGCGGISCRKGCSTDSDCGPATPTAIPICACDNQIPDCRAICQYASRGFR
jgi:hypothetical protein